MLPDLLRRLAFATVARDCLHKIDFPAGAETQRPDYDGTTVTSEGTAFVPKGVGFWELGCEVGNARGKAQRDYDLRIKEHQERLARGETENLKEATFIAVTALDWQKAKEWKCERMQDGHFGAVRAYDSNTLEHWIQDAPAVGLWLAQEIHGKREGVSDLAAHWGCVQATLRRPLPPKVLLVNRDAAGDSFEQWLKQPGGELAVKSPSASELVAVFCAWLQTLPADRQDEISSRAIIVESRESWGALSTSRQRLILVASPRLEIDADLLGDALRQGHHVLRFAGFSAPRNQATELPMMRRFDLQKALEEAGLPEPDARQLAEAAGGNFTILRRRFAKTADPAPWARESSLAPLLLAAAWEDGRVHDQRVVSELADKKYSEVQALMKRWRSEPDSPVRYVLGTWEFLSPVDAWEALHHLITTAQMDCFERLATEVLSEDNPALDLPPDERFMASVKGKVRRFSSALRRGIAEILALGATREAESSVGTELQFAARASCIIRKLLPPGCEWQRWASLGDLLPLLVEAMPDNVLEAIEKDIVSEKPQLVELMKQETPGGVMGAIYHSGVLWALETAAWPKERLQRVSLCLTRLAKLDPGGTWSNRPSESLKSLFFSWRPQTVASVSERIDALHYLQQKEVSEIWKVILDLLPESHESITDNPKPSYRNWAAGWTGFVTKPDCDLFISEIANVAVTMAESDSSRWPDLLNHVTQLPPRDFQKMVAGLEKLTSQPIDARLRTKLWDKLRETVQRHTRFHDAWWALPQADVAKLTSLRDRLAPADLVTVQAPLFNDDGLMDGDESESYDQKRERRERERRVSIRTMWDAGGEGIILELVQKVRQPWAVGWALAAELGVETSPKIIPTHLATSNEAISNFAAAFARQCIHANGSDWAEGQMSSDWTTDQVAAWALQMEFEPRTWDWVLSRGDAVRQAYWTRTSAWGGRNLDLPSRSRAVTELQAVGRAWSALQLLMQAKYDKCPLSHTVVCEALEAVTAIPTERPAGAMDVHHIHEAFEFLQDGSGVDESRVARLEFAFLPFLDRHSRLPWTLQRQLARDPDFFVECLKLLYRERHRPSEGGDDDGEHVTDAEKAEKAKRIWHLIHDWRTIPGTGDDGEVSVDALRSWIRATRQKAREADRIEVCDLTLGELFAHSPEDADKGKPVLAIREAIEECESEELERGFAMGLHNLRGCYSKGLYEGGKQERELASQYERYAVACARWPRTAAVLRGVAQAYLRQADEEDEQARARD